MEITVWMKLAIFVVILIIAYFVLRYYEMDPVLGMWEAVSEVEWDITALVLTIGFSSIMWAIMWKTSMWATPEEAYRFTQITGVPMKVILSVLLPIIGYPLAVRARNK